MTLTLNLSHESSRRTAYRTVRPQTLTEQQRKARTTSTFNLRSRSQYHRARRGHPGKLRHRHHPTTQPQRAVKTITIRWYNDATGIGNGDATPATIDFTGTITDNDSGETNPVTTLVQDAPADDL